MNKTKLTVGIVLIFLLGALTGVLAGQLYQRGDRLGHPPKHRSAAERTEFILERLTDDLDLSPTQVAEIRPIVEKSEKDVSAILDRVDPDLRKIHEQGFEGIRAKLEPDQQRKFDEFRERIERSRPKAEKP